MKNVPTTTVVCGNFLRDSWHKCSECFYSVYLVQEQFSCSRLDFVTYLAKLLLALEIGVKSPNQVNLGLTLDVFWESSESFKQRGRFKEEIHSA
jgi:hypothetical protein